MATVSKPENLIVVCPFTVLVENRERAAYSFCNLTCTLPKPEQAAGKTLIVPTRTTYLQTGDYTIEGFEDQIAVERKSLEDAYGTLGGGRERFEREIERLNALDFAAIIIEATWQELIRPQETRGESWRSRLDPRSVWGTIWCWQERYRNVRWVTIGSHRLGELATFEMLSRWWKAKKQERQSA